jgi:hypothetical protein
MVWVKYPSIFFLIESACVRDSCNYTDKKIKRKKNHKKPTKAKTKKDQKKGGAGRSAYEEEGWYQMQRGGALIIFNSKTVKLLRR